MIIPTGLIQLGIERAVSNYREMRGAFRVYVSSSDGRSMVSRCNLSFVSTDDGPGLALVVRDRDSDERSLIILGSSMTGAVARLFVFRKDELSIRLADGTILRIRDLADQGDMREVALLLRKWCGVDVLKARRFSPRSAIDS